MATTILTRRAFTATTTLTRPLHPTSTSSSTKTHLLSPPHGTPAQSHQLNVKCLAAVQRAFLTSRTFHRSKTNNKPDHPKNANPNITNSKDTRRRDDDEPTVNDRTNPNSLNYDPNFTPGESYSARLSRRLKELFPDPRVRLFVVIIFCVLSTAETVAWVKVLWPRIITGRQSQQSDSTPDSEDPKPKPTTSA
ncbi:hypothetical protein QBC46DRAFT_444947 [Diplogelasinospora grovesii]|uniref:Uncharacterized protein n=1 Tax=Diplogelasinospora grovesii TaxID=303347 RepID=A0AAN6NI32_9PEZI|nr:hypothetical protein QBC46DRAFT_444947 [Diplogelasinospora grovesii]